MNTSDQINELAKALCKAQGAMEDAEKGGLNPHFKSRYADLANVRSALRGPLSQNGLAYVQTVRSGDGWVEIETRLVHESGQFLGDTLRIPLQQATAQAVGSAISYGRRYSLMALVGLAAEDDDGNAAQPAQPRAARQTAPARKSAGRPEPKDGEELRDRLGANEAAMVERGLCKSGELVKHVRDSMRRAGWDMDVLDLPEPAIRLAVEVAKAFQQERREAAKRPDRGREPQKVG